MASAPERPSLARPASAPAARRTDGRRVRDDPVYHKTGVLYAQYDGGAVPRPRSLKEESMASTATPADSVAKWPTRWRQKATTPCAGRALQGILKDKAAKHKRDQMNSKSQRVRKPPRLMHEALAVSLSKHQEREFRREWRRWVHEDCRFFGRPGSGIFGDEAYPLPFGAGRGVSTPLRLETAAAERSDYEYIWQNRGGSKIWKRRVVSVASPTASAASTSGSVAGAPLGGAGARRVTSSERARPTFKPPNFPPIATQQASAKVSTPRERSSLSSGAPKVAE